MQEFLPCICFLSTEIELPKVILLLLLLSLGYSHSQDPFPCTYIHNIWYSARADDCESAHPHTHTHFLQNIIVDEFRVCGIKFGYKLKFVLCSKVFNGFQMEARIYFWSGWGVGIGMAWLWAPKTIALTSWVGGVLLLSLQIHSLNCDLAKLIFALFDIK